MIDKLNEALALGDKMRELCGRVRTLLRVAPEIAHPRVGQAYCDTDGQWWCIGVWACASQDEAQMLVERMEPEA